MQAKWIKLDLTTCNVSTPSVGYADRYFTVQHDQHLKQANSVHQINLSMLMHPPCTGNDDARSG